MSSELERNKDLVVQMFQKTWNEGRLDFVSEALTEDFQDHPPKRFFATPLQGRSSLVDVVEAFRAGFSDFHFQMLRLTAEGDRVFCLGRATGTHDGTFFGTPATGRRIDVLGINEFRVRDGKLSERWGMFNVMGLMQQIGLLGSGPGGNGHG